MNIEIKMLNDRAEPIYNGSRGSAGFDLGACIEEPIALPAGRSAMIPTGLAIWIKDVNIVGCIYPRSGLGAKAGLILGNSVGIIDSDYQGELMISAYNRNPPLTKQGAGMVAGNTIIIEPGMRLAQIVFHKIEQPTFELVQEFGDGTERGSGGFGSTGK